MFVSLFVGSLFRQFVSSLVCLLVRSFVIYFFLGSLVRPLASSFVCLFGRPFVCWFVSFFVWLFDSLCV